jgi:hypothetical protein
MDLERVFVIFACVSVCVCVCVCVHVCRRHWIKQWFLMQISYNLTQLWI